MTRLIPIFVGALCLGACASSGDPVASDNPDPPAPEKEEIAIIDAPAVAQAAEPDADPRHDQRICHREIRTGTHRAVRVCRTPAEMERMEEEGKDTFRDLRRSQMQKELADQIDKH
ncbi:MAG: hypothetical protein GWN47_10815 [Woeseiaceae bacterium]|nr:hypothetical protein [Woeseiaceae bacterium]